MGASRLESWLFFAAAALALIAAAITWVRHGQFSLPLVAAGLFLAAVGAWRLRRGPHAGASPR